MAEARITISETDTQTYEIIARYRKPAHAKGEVISERRMGQGRRSVADRRVSNSAYGGPERRKGGNRRGRAGWRTSSQEPTECVKRELLLAISNSQDSCEDSPGFVRILCGRILRSLKTN